MSVEEPKAENRYLLTEELFREGMGRVMRESFGPAVKKALAAMGALWLALAAFTVSRSGRLSLALVELLALAAAGWFLAVSVPKRRTRRAWEALRDRSGGEMERLVRFYADRLEVAPGGRRIPYEEIDKVLETKRLLVLITRGRAGILVTKDGFTLGDGETVARLIDERRK